MSNENNKPLEQIKNFYYQMSRQYSEESGAPLRESKLKSGFAVLYFWAIAHNNADAKKNIKEEAAGFFVDVNEYLKAIEDDFKVMRESNPDIIKNFNQVTEEEHDLLVEYLEKDWKEK